jgi:VWFA-related protein
VSKRLAPLCGLLFLLAAPPSQADAEPVPSDLEERVAVDLTLIDAVVIDGKGRSIDDLGIDDFLLSVDGRAVSIDSVDVRCGGDARQKLVLALDYSHLDVLQRGQVLDHLKALVRDDVTPSMDVMVAALTDELRVEQELTSDRPAVIAGLDRMQRDSTLWKPSFHHQNEQGFVDVLVSLIEVVGREDGAKVVLLYSAIGDVPLERQFEAVAAAAATSRTVIYPVDVRGLVTGQRDLSAFSRIDEGVPDRLISPTPKPGIARVTAGQPVPT